MGDQYVDKALHMLKNEPLTSKGTLGEIHTATTRRETRESTAQSTTLQLATSLCRGATISTFKHTWGQPFKVLDVGCGTGIWAEEFAANHPAADVLGVDITPPQENETQPDNVHFVAADVEKPWDFASGGQFSFIKARLMTNAIKDWPIFLQRCSQHLSEGGWLELNDVYFPFAAQNPLANAETSPFLHFSQLVEQAWGRMGWDGRACHRHADRLRLLGFDSILEKDFFAAAGDWPETQPDKTIGYNTKENWAVLMRKMGPGLLEKALQLPADTASRVVEDMLKDIEDNGDRMRYCFPEKVVIARKAAK